MAREFSRKFYNSSAWKKCRASYVSKRVACDGGMCETCGQELGKIVHHKMWLTPENINDPMVALNHENLKYDCQICHNQEKENEEEEQLRYYFVDGNIILIPPEDEQE